MLMDIATQCVRGFFVFSQRSTRAAPPCQDHKHQTNRQEPKYRRKPRRALARSQRKRSVLNVHHIEHFAIGGADKVGREQMARRNHSVK